MLKVKSEIWNHRITKLCSWRFILNRYSYLFEWTIHVGLAWFIRPYLFNQTRGAVLVFTDICGLQTATVSNVRLGPNFTCGREKVGGKSLTDETCGWCCERVPGTLQRAVEKFRESGTNILLKSKAFCHCLNKYVGTVDLGYVALWKKEGCVLDGRRAYQHPPSWDGKLN